MPGSYSNQRRSYGQLTEYSRNLETPTVPKLVNKLPVFYGPRIYERSVLILTSHPWPEIRNGIFLPGFSTKFQYAFLVTPGRAICPGYIRSKMRFADTDLVRHIAVPLFNCLRAGLLNMAAWVRTAAFTHAGVQEYASPLTLADCLLCQVTICSTPHISPRNISLGYDFNRLYVLDVIEHR